MSLRTHGPWAFYALALLLLVLFSSGCTFSRMAKKAERQQKITVDPAVLMVRGPLVPVEITAQLPANLLRNDYKYGIRIYYKAIKGVEEHVGSLAFDFGNYNFVDRKPTMQRSFSIAYAPSKVMGQLMAQGVVTNPKGRKKFTKSIILAPGIRTTPYLTQTIHSPAYVPDEGQKTDSGVVKFMIFYDQGLATLRTGVGTNLQLLDEFLKTNPKTRQIEILGTQSPDSAEARTQNLAMRRAVALENFIKKKIDTESYASTLSTIEFKKQAISYSWNAFLGRIEDSALPEDQVQQILAIVNGPGSFTQKEKALQDLPSYDYLDMYVYPVLRYAQATINYKPNPRREYEVYLLAKKIVQNRANPDVLTAAEMEYAASLTPLLAEKKKIYEATVQNYMTWQALNNLGMVNFEQAQKEVKPAVRKSLLASAIHNFRYSAHRNPTAERFYNLAVAHHQKGDALEAMQSYDYAVKLGGKLPMLQQVFTDKAALEMELGQYDDAVRSITYAGDSYAAQFNRTLLYFLKENYDGSTALAQKLLTQFPNDARTYYLLAIIGARTQQEDMMAENLNKAVNLQPDLAGKAIEDLEFRGYQKSAAFQQAMKKR